MRCNEKYARAVSDGRGCMCLGLFRCLQRLQGVLGTKLKDTILAREGLVVVRPDSGELPNIVVDVLEALGSKFDTTTTSTGHKLLPPTVRMIQGDGVSMDSLKTICNYMK